jgi:predicted NAD/FAD-binding protein
MKLAVVGSGIAGLSSAWLLGRAHEVTLYEAAGRLGGHTNTVDVTLDGVTHPVDTGFLVFNRRTYPNLVALFRLLGVQSVDSEMSFAVSLDEGRVEWAGSSLATLFAQKANLARPAFWGMLQDILRFNRETTRMDPGAAEDVTLGEYLRRGGYGEAFRDWYLLPMAAAIWSCPTGQMLEYPLSTFVNFCRNHGLLQILDRPRWLTVRGGAREYVRALARDIHDLRLATPVASVRRHHSGILLEAGGRIERYDGVVFACHSDQTLAILGQDADPAERATLGAVRYQPNRAVLHTDERLLPRHPGVWSAWNYLGGRGDPDRRPVSVSYLINRLQPLPFRQPVIVSLNPFREPEPDRVIAEFDYAHPVFDRAATGAQARLAELQGRRNTWYCGAWTGYGFHEDGLRSALAVAGSLGVRAPWQAAERAAA